MKKELFKQLAASLKEGGAILRGKKQPARSTTLQAPDAKAVREKLDLSQNKFAALIGINPARSRTGSKAIANPKAPPAPSSASPSPIPRQCWTLCTGDFDVKGCFCENSLLRVASQTVANGRLTGLPPEPFKMSFAPMVFVKKSRRFRIPSTTPQHFSSLGILS